MQIKCCLNVVVETNVSPPWIATLAISLQAVKASSNAIGQMEMEIDCKWKQEETERKGFPA